MSDPSDPRDEDSQNPTVPVDDPAATRAVSRPPADGEASTHAVPGPPSEPAAVELQRGDQLGRYILLDKLGQGGMGVVYSAYDPSLRRRVAIKLWLVRGGGSASGEGQQRLLREAKALAQLSHPNVVSVYDVGLHGQDQVFMAMELVDGQTVSQWVKKESPDWRAIARVFLQAGAGLAAAHDTGLVHRDIKSSNILVGNDGRVFVMDFGLARAKPSPAATPAAASALLELSGDEDDSGSIDTGSTTDSFDSASDLAAPLTRAGVVMGTLGYLAPELCDQAPPAPASDQFAFCVALYRMLYRILPYPRDNAARPAEQRHWELIAPSAERRGRVPAWLHRVVVRGLSVDPADRYPSMRELLADLAYDPGRRWRRAGAVAAAVVALAGAAIGVQSWRAGRVQLCNEEAQRITRHWNPDRAQQLQRVFSASTAGHAQETWQRVRTRLQQYTDTWMAQRTGACAATVIRGEQSERVMDLRMACLDRAQVELAASVEVLENADDLVVHRALHLLDELPVLSQCADIATLQTDTQPPENLRPGIDELRVQLARVLALHRVGRHEAALPLAENAITEAEKLGFDPLLARARLATGTVAAATGAQEKAREELVAAFHLSLRLRDYGLAATAAGRAALVTEGASRLRWGRIATSLARGRAPDSILEARTQDLRGKALMAAEQFDDAVTAFTTAAAILDRSVDGGSRPTSAVARFRHNLAVAHRRAGNNEDALREEGAAHEAMIEAFGPSHPNVGVSQEHLAVLHGLLGNQEAAEHERQTAVELRGSTDGADRDALL